MIRPLLWLPLAMLSLAPIAAHAADLEQKARALHTLAGQDYCDDIDNEPFENGYQQWDVSYQPDWTDDEDQKQEMTLIQIFCFSGAYNISYNYYSYDDMQGLQPIGFATPVFDVQYENDDYEGDVEKITITGYSADRALVNSEFDPETGTLTSYSKWRGLGDASSSGTWRFDQGTFVLERYDVDASYNDEMDPETIVDFRPKKSK